MGVESVVVECELEGVVVKWGVESHVARESQGAVVSSFCGA